VPVLDLGSALPKRAAKLAFDSHPGAAGMQPQLSLVKIGEPSFGHIPF
jgi:hypothetical protein